MTIFQGDTTGVLAGQEARDQTALRDVALASLNGVELPESLAELLQEVRRSPEDIVQTQEPAAPDAAGCTASPHFA